MKKTNLMLITLAMIVCLNFIVSSAKAAFYSYQISPSDTATQSKILQLVKAKEGTAKYNKMYYLFYTSHFAAASRETWPHLNSMSSVSKVTDNGETYTLDKSARGCTAYSYFVSKYVFNKSSLNYNYINATTGSYTGEDIKQFILLYAQCGEHIRISDTHSISYIVNDANGFYYLSYYADSNPYIYIAYTTWENFATECNSKNKKIWIYDADTSINANAGYDTITVYNYHPDSADIITDNNAVLYGTVEKPSVDAAEKFGIRIRRTTNTYANGWSYYHNASSSYAGKTSIKIWFDVQEEVGITLTHATSYTYQLYAKIDNKEYWSEEKTFTTTGSHSYGAWSTTKAATCTEEGTKQRLCACGKKETSQFAALGHDYSDTWTVEKKQTCTEDGLKYRLCTRCSSKADITTLSATGHNYSQWKTILEATCTTDGRMERSCTCGSIEYQAVASTGHNWSNWIQTTAATTQTDGEEIRSCNLCMQVQTRSIPKLSADGHTHIFSESGWIEILPATCMEDGKKERYCQLCYGPETQIIPALSHSFTPWQTQTEATTEQDGLSVRECVLCGAEEMLTIPKLNAPDPTPTASTTPGTTNANEPAPPTESIADDAPILPTDSINTTDVPTEDNFDKVDVLIIIATVSLLFGVGATTALVVVTVKKRR